MKSVICTKTRKGMFYSIDALVALLIIVLASSVYLFYNDDTLKEINYGQIHYYAEDGMQLLGTLRLSDVDENIKQNILVNTNITLEDTNKNLDEIIAMLWAYNQSDYIEILLNSVFNNTLISDKYEYSLVIEDQNSWTNIYNSSSFDTDDMSFMASSSKIVSGYKENTDPFGFVARVWASTIRRNSTLVIPFQPQGSGWGGNHSDPGVVNITKYFEINENMTIYSADFYISLHSVNDSYNVVDFNDGLCAFNRTSFSHNDSFFDVVDVKNCLKNGTNKIKLSLRNYNFHGHIHPGTRLEVFYEEEVVVKQPSASNIEDFFFDDLYSVGGNDSKTGAWMIYSFYVDPSYGNRDVNLHINIKDFEDTYAYDENGTFINSTDIRIYMNQEDPIWVDGESLCPDKDNRTPMPWDINCSYLHQNHTVNVADKPFIYCSKETYMSDALSYFTNITTWFDINKNETSRQGCFNDLQGDYFKVALLEDPHLRTSAGNCNPGTGSGDNWGMAKDFSFDGSGVVASGNTLDKGKVVNNGGSDIWIDKMNVSWWPSNGGEDLTEVKIKNVLWTGTSNSGNIVDLTDFKLKAGKKETLKLTFNFQSDAKSGYNLTFIFTDGSEYTQSYVCFDSDNPSTEREIIEDWVSRGGLLFISEHIKTDLANVTFGNRGKNLCDAGKDNNPGTVYSSFFTNGSLVDITDVVVDVGEKQAFELQFNDTLNWNPLTRVKLYYSDGSYDDFYVNHENVSKELLVGNKSKFLLAESSGNKASFRVDSNDTSSYTITQILFEFDNSSLGVDSIKSYDNCLESADFVTVINEDDLTTLTPGMSFYPEEIPYVENANATVYKTIGEYEDGTDGLARWDYGNGTVMYLSDFNNLFTGNFPLEVRHILEQLLIQANSVYDLELDINITNYTIDGTNVLGVYVNNYDDFAWGEDYTHIYSDPINNPNASSRVTITYSSGRNVEYGLIEVSQTKLFGGNISGSKDINYTYPSEADSIYRTFVHISQIESNKTRISAGVNGSLSEVYSSKFSFATPTTLFIPESYFSLKSNNSVRIDDITNNSILPNTTLEYRFYVPSVVGYGNTFPNSTSAVIDAQNRLKEVMGDVVDATEIANSSISSGGIPWMYGPLIIHFQVWG